MRAKQPRYLRLETLDDRIVPAVTVLDLTAAGSFAVAPSGAIVQQTDAQPTGTGFIQSFVRVQGYSPGGGIEQGLNTDGRPLQFDEKASASFTRSLTLSDVPIVVVNGVAYREFLLDINQKASSPLLSLDEVQVFLGGVSNLTGYDAAANTLAGQAAVFDLDTNGDVSVKLDANLNSGSGSGDMLLLIPNLVFAGADPSSFVYLYSLMGDLEGASANGGFEEWAVTSTPPSIPGGTASISGRVFFDANQNGVLEPGPGPVPIDRGLPNVTIHLSGVNDLGINVVLMTTTDANGFYSFTGLRAGQYSIWETQPDGFDDGLDYVGSAGGEESNDMFANIQLFDGQNAIDYIFTEQITE